MRRNNFYKVLVSSVIATTLLVGCGSSSDSSNIVEEEPTRNNSISGTVAIGAGIYAQVEILDTQTCDKFTSYSDTNGYWTSGDLSGTSGPYLLKASSSIGVNMYSYVDLNDTSTANITPLTYYVTDSASRTTGRSIVQEFSNCSPNSFDVSTFETNLSTQLAQLNAALQNAGYTNSNQIGFDHFNGSFEANQTGYDALLDEIDMSMNNNDTVLRLGNRVLDTTGEDISSNPTMAILGEVVDSSGNPLDSVTVEIKRDNLNETLVETLTTNNSGEYTKTDLETYREYIITFSKDGYSSTNLKYNTFERGVNPNQVILFTESETAENTQVSSSISVINSRTGDTISDITINVREGFNNRLGSTISEINTSNTNFISLSPGLYTFELIKNGYRQTFENKIINSTLTELNFNMLANTDTEDSSSDNDAFATIILTWGENPRDVDSHTILTVDDSNIDVYFANKSYGATPIDKNNPCATDDVVVSLDLDDVTSYGPETTTICDGTKGPFTFKVHHFSGNSNIGQSPTNILVRTKDGSQYEFTAPTTGFTGTNSDVWNVFTLDRNQNITRINTITQDGDQLGSLFSTGGTDILEYSNTSYSLD